MPLLRTGMQTETMALRTSLLCGLQPLNKATCYAVGYLGAREPLDKPRGMRSLLRFIIGADMCGISGIINLSGQAIETNLLVKMNDALSHRGPDDEGYVLVQQHEEKCAEFCGHDSHIEVRDAFPHISSSLKNSFEANIGLAHRRFSIIDLSSRGHQPFFNSSQECCVITNGEIYNYVEIRKDLEGKGHTFRSNSDTEVIVEAYKAWGVQCFTRMNGMWALALYDFKRRILIISRDRFGKIPLYWTKHQNIIYFASEIKSLLQIAEVAQAKAVYEAAIFPYLAHSRRDLDNTTFFDGIYAMPAASWAILNEHFPQNIRQYWQLPTKRLRERDISIQQATAAIRETLEDAVRIRLRADVPWCVELSGGMDSSALVVLASHLSKKQLTTYTVRFPENEWNEEHLARSVAHHCRTDHRVVDSPLENFWPEILPFTYLQEEPYHSPNLHTNQVIRRMMRAEGIKMLLNGAAGDELFAGYRRYFRQAQTENLLNARIGSFFDNGLQWSENPGPVWGLTMPFVETVKQAANGIVAALGLKKGTYSYVKAGSSVSNPDVLTLTKSLYHDVTNTKIPYWMSSGNKTTMGIPLEHRLPFLDFRVVELAFSLPVTYLIRHGWHKWILRKALEDVLPQDIVWRKKKMGFPFPFGRFLSNSQKFIKIIVQNASNPYVDLSSAIGLMQRENWRLLSFLLWYELFFNSNHEIFSQIYKQHKATTHSVDVDYGFFPAFLTARKIFP